MVMLVRSQQPSKTMLQSNKLTATVSYHSPCSPIDPGIGEDSTRPPRVALPLYCPFLRGGHLTPQKRGRAAPSPIHLDDPAPDVEPSRHLSPRRRTSPSASPSPRYQVSVRRHARSRGRGGVAPPSATGRRRRPSPP
jgi:hypothetical protein